MHRVPGGATAVAGVIGDPVTHSCSPAILNAAFAELGLDWVYLAFTVAQGSAPDAVRSMRALGIRGLSVTMPHKAAVLTELDALSTTAERLGAVNCIASENGRLVGHNTDGAGFLDALAAVGHRVDGRRCVVIGAGGAARAVVLALADAGAREVVVVNRSPERAEAAAELAGAAGRVAGHDRLGDALESASLLVNATPLGMTDGDPSPVPSELLRADLFVNDLIYHPAVTPLTTAATATGATALNGLGMLVHQAAAALRIWTGLEPPIEAMTAAARAAG